MVFLLNCHTCEVLTRTHVAQTTHFPCAVLCCAVLLQAVEAWDPRRDTIPVHAWVLPWCSVMGDDRMSLLWPTLKRKFEAALRDWTPSDPSAKALLGPWNKVNAFATVFTRCILPKLADVLRAVDLNPADSAATNRAVAVLKSILSWQVRCWLHINE